MGLGELKQSFQLAGTSGEGYWDARAKIGGDIRTHGDCQPDEEGPGEDTPTNPGESEGGGVLGNQPTGNPSIGLGTP